MKNALECGKHSVVAPVFCMSRADWGLTTDESYRTTKLVFSKLHVFFPERKKKDKIF